MSSLLYFPPASSIRSDELREMNYQSELTKNMTKKEHDVEFLEYVVKSLVDNADAVKAVRTVDEMGVLITLSVAPEDMGKIIGRSCNTAKALRIILRVVGMKNNARVNLNINEPEGSTRPMRPALKSVDEAMDDLKI